jgi:transposase
VHPSGVVIRRIVLDQGIVVLEGEGTARAGRCPGCGTSSAQVHDRYARRPLDEPWRGCVVRWHLRVRRFRCPCPTCPRATFAESFGEVLGRRAQRTAACTALLEAIAVALGGEAGARLAKRAGLPVSPDTLLRLLKGGADALPIAVRVLGVDDFALRRRHTYGTLLVDLETHRPIDLLESREAAPLATWLRQHPGIEIIVRDRAGAYAEGARAGAPAAQQVADRFHLLQNATEALNEVLKGRRRQIEIAEQQAAAPSDLSHADIERSGTPATPLPVRLESRTKQQARARRARRVARWEEVRARRAQGQSILQIARELGMHRRTVRSLLKTPDPPRNRGTPTPRPTGLASPTLQPYVPYLQDCWEAGCHNGAQLHRELVAQGYPGSYSLLQQALTAWRPPRPSRDPTGQQPRASTRRFPTRSLCLRLPEHLDAAERRALDTLLEQEPDIAAGRALAQRFHTLIAKRSLAEFATWLRDARASGLPSFVSLANGLEADRAAVEAALTTTWSTGPVEGHVHRLKLIKRQGYGRAAFSLLRRRVLAA